MNLNCTTGIGLVLATWASAQAPTNNQVGRLSAAEIELEMARLATLHVSAEFTDEFTTIDLSLVALGDKVESLLRVHQSPFPSTLEVAAAAAEARSLMARANASAFDSEIMLHHFSRPLEIVSTPAMSTEVSGSLGVLNWGSGGLAYRPAARQLTLETRRQLPSPRDIPFLLRPLPVRPVTQDALRTYIWARDDSSGNDGAGVRMMIREPAESLPVLAYAYDERGSLPRWGVSFNADGFVQELTTYAFSSTEDGVLLLDESMSLAFGPDSVLTIFYSKLVDRVLRSSVESPKLEIPSGAHLNDFTSGTANKRWMGVDPDGWPSEVRDHVAFAGSIPKLDEEVPPSKDAKFAGWLSIAAIGLVVLGLILLWVFRSQLDTKGLA